MVGRRFFSSAFYYTEILYNQLSFLHMRRQPDTETDHPVSNPHGSIAPYSASSKGVKSNENSANEVGYTASCLPQSLHVTEYGSMALIY
jgi:hypothetical protein